ncbi:MAG: hypothetical protein A4E69_00274 [Syntrophus sp. PtaB.Bin138]|nr:MAG: hypothetical protein A4E69_00274 [Syntrophus sp. PtaB.Bin138]
MPCERKSIWPNAARAAGLARDEAAMPCEEEIIWQDYQSLQNVLEDAYRQASQGKGAERHAKGEPFEEQKICEITRRLIGSPIQSLLYQAVKKIYETTRTDPIPELLGAINYIAAGIIILRELEETAPNPLAVAARNGGRR